MDLADRVFLASLVTLALLVLVIERCKPDVPAHVMPPPAGSRLLKFANVPDCRTGEVIVEDVAYMDVSDAAEGEWDYGYG